MKHYSRKNSVLALLLSFIILLNSIPMTVLAADKLRVSVTAGQTSAELGEIISATASASGGDGSYKYAWKVTRNGSTVDETDFSFGEYYSYTVDEEGSYVFTAYVKDGNGTQVSSDSAAITVGDVEPVYEALKITVSAGQRSAEVGETISATATATGGDGDYSYAWVVTCDGETVDETDLSFGDYYSYTTDKEGSYVFTAYVEDGNGTQVSASSSSITVTKKQTEELRLSVTADQSSVMVGETISATATATGGDGDYSYAWVVSCDGETVDETDLSFGDYYSYTPDKAGNYVFTAYVRDGNDTQVSASSSPITVTSEGRRHDFGKSDSNRR